MTASIIGIAYNELLDMDIRTFNNYVDGFITRREIRMNDSKDVGHAIAAKIAQAVWGDKQFVKPIKEFKLHENTEVDIAESRNRRVYETLKAKGVIK